MKNDDVVVKNSKIEGKGVFASRDFKKGERVLCWDTSTILSKEDIKKLSEDELRYVVFWNKKYLKLKNPEKYVNHSCEPNTAVKNFCDVAIRDIKKGEEITGNYEENALPGETMECNCRSRKCKKIIKI